MNHQPIYVVDIMKSVVDATSVALQSDPSSYLEYLNESQQQKFTSTFSGRNINYIYGDRDEINKRLQLLSQGRETKNTLFPLVALVMPFQIIDGEFWQVPLLKIIIATVTPESLLFPERYEQFFKPVLYPVYYELLTQFSYKTVQSDYQTMTPTVTEVPKFVPTEKDGITNNIVDALVVEIPNSKFFTPLNCN